MEGLLVSDGEVLDDGRWRGEITTEDWLTGPPGIVQGGMAAGMLLAAARAADPLAAPVTRIDARLRAPTIAGTTVTATCQRLAAGRHHVEVSGPSGVTVSGEVELRGPDLPARVPDLVALAAGTLPPEVPQYAYPGCWVCGPDNPHGLHLHPRLAREDLIRQTWWPPDQVESAVSPGTIDPMAIAAVMDCPTVWASMGHLADGMTAFLLAGYRVQFFADADMGDDYRIVGRPDKVDGRKVEARAALLDDRARPVAVAWALQYAVAELPEASA